VEYDDKERPTVAGISTRVEIILVIGIMALYPLPLTGCG
jgi:hypothetical protein